MTKRATTIVCFCAAALLAAGLAFSAGCGYYSGNRLDGDVSEGTVTSQGGFLVEKGDYIYFVNGDESYTATNKYGKVVKGAIMRMTREDLAARNYANAETVVPLVVYSGNNDAGIFIYGDKVYYATPSTEKNSDGDVLNDYLEFKSSNLDGSKTMKNYYVQIDSNTTEYRYVEVDGTVYLMYVAEDESYFDETTGVTNLHSYNTETGDNTILAYNISSCIFDSDDVSNPRVYYTMDVENYSASSTFDYNQVYTVTADATEEDGIVLDESNSPEDVFGEKIIGWTTKEAVEDDDDDDNDYDYDRYINLGQLVYDGIGKLDVSENGNGYEYGYTPFNYGYGEVSSENDYTYCNGVRYTYTLGKYTNGYLFYTRNTSNLSNYMFAQKESEMISATDGNVISTAESNPISRNPESGTKLLADGSSAANYMYLFDEDGEFDGVMYAESTGISVNYLDDGTLRDEVATQDAEGRTVLNTEDRANIDSKYYYIDKEAVATLLFTTDDGYLYYSTTGTNGISLWRVNYTGTWDSYNGMPNEVDYTDEYIPVQILDLDAVSGWYNPEIVDGQIIFAADFDDMTTFNYLMVCDLRETNDDGSFVTDSNGNYVMMNNKEISAYNDQLSDLQDAIDDYDDTDTYPTADYANMYSAIQFAFITRDNDYIDDLAVMCNDAAWDEDEDADPVYSDKTLALYHNFIRAKGDWADYADESKVINGETVYSNSRDYYYSLFGVMSDDDADSWLDEAKSSYLQDEPDISWYDSLSTAWKVVFIVGMCLCGLVVIAGITLLTIFLVRRSRRRAERRKAADIQVKTDVNRQLNVYDTAAGDIPEDTVMDMEGNIISGDASEVSESGDSANADEAPAEDAPAGEEPKDAE
ncbi:MAG: hypothetical protein LUE27_06185 [Clostridia bacterium]|nr:hypothetical protein [Clostridia bacterium]